MGWIPPPPSPPPAATVLVEHLVGEAKDARAEADTYLTAFLTLAGINGFCLVLFLAGAIYRFLEWCFEPTVRHEKTELIEIPPEIKEESTVTPKEKRKNGKQPEKERVATETDSDDGDRV